MTHLQHIHIRLVSLVNSPSCFLIAPHSHGNAIKSIECSKAPYGSSEPVIIPQNQEKIVVDEKLRVARARAFSHTSPESMSFLSRVNLSMTTRIEQTNAIVMMMR
jgi:hypothetical protein